MIVINWAALHYIFETSDKNYKVAQSFRASLDENIKSNFNSKHLALFLIYVSITSNLNHTTNFLTMKPYGSFKYSHTTTVLE